MPYDLDCPYCDAPLEVNHDDGGGYDENETHQQECDECGKTFVFTTSVTYRYNPDKADCLNGDAEHDWQPTRTFPKYFTKMRCYTCDEERAPTNEERIKFDIPLTYENENNR